MPTVPPRHAAKPHSCHSLRNCYLFPLPNGARATSPRRFVRPPYGANAFTQRLKSIAADQGYLPCRWTSDTSDWDNTPAAVMAGKVRYGDYRTAPVYRGGVVLMHMAGEHTVPGLQRVINAVRGKGLKLERLP